MSIKLTGTAHLRHGNTFVEMRLVAVNNEIQGRVRSVYDEGDGRGEYVITSGDKVFLDVDREYEED